MGFRPRFNRQKWGLKWIELVGAYPLGIPTKSGWRFQILDMFIPMWDHDPNQPPTINHQPDDFWKPWVDGIVQLGSPTTTATEHLQTGKHRVCFK